MGLIRLTGGEWSGRRIAAAGGPQRPSQTRLRLAVFSSLGNAVPGARVLDLYAGSGAYGFEALSRGADRVCWVESDPRACRTIRANLLALAAGGPETASRRIVRGDAMCPSGYAGYGPFDLVFADPPYAVGRAGGMPRALQRALADSGALAPSALLVYEAEASAPMEPDPAWDVLRNRRCGGSRWVICRAPPRRDGGDGRAL